MHYLFIYNEMLKWAVEIKDGKSKLGHIVDYEEAVGLIDV